MMDFFTSLCFYSEFSTFMHFHVSLRATRLLGQLVSFDPDDLAHGTTL